MKKAALTNGVLRNILETRKRKGELTMLSRDNFLREDACFILDGRPENE